MRWPFPESSAVWGNVLITAASRRVALVQAFQRGLRARQGGQVIVTDINPLSPAVHVADRAYLVPMSDAPNYLDEIASICDAEHVRLVVPTIDDELERFAQARGWFRARGVVVAVSAPDTAALCNDKYRTCRRLSEAGVAAAATCLPNEAAGLRRFPLFVKPRVGRGGVGAYRVRNARELEFFLGYVSDPIVQEYLEGPEFTIDVLCGFDGSVLSVVPRERVVIRAGVIDRGRTSDDPALIALARDCAATMAFAGAVNIQCRVVGGRPVVFEINPRFSGGIPLTIASGADFPGMLLDLVDGRTVPAAVGRFQPDFWMTSYEASFFLDDDRVTALRESGGAELIGDAA
jgi:carbamoyl-phosphate synthase large subunit